MMRVTNKLRFVDREISLTGDAAFDNIFGSAMRSTPERVLQQWWENDSQVVKISGVAGCDIYQHPGEWRDVPVEDET